MQKQRERANKTEVGYQINRGSSLHLSLPFTGFFSICLHSLNLFRQCISRLNFRMECRALELFSSIFDGAESAGRVESLAALQKKKGRCKIRWRSARSIPYSSVTCAELPWTSSKRADQIEKTDCPFKGITIGCLNAVVHYSTPKQYLLFCTTQYLCRGQTHLPMASATCLFYVNIPVSQSCLDVIQPSTAVVLGPKNRSCWHSGIRMCSVHVPVFTQ